MGGNKVFAFYMGFFYLTDQTPWGLAQKINIKLKK